MLSHDDGTSPRCWAAWHVQEERSSPVTSIKGPEQAPADTAAERAPQPALAARCNSFLVSRH